MMPSDREKTLPTRQAGWAHVLSLPRELRLDGGRLRQYAIAELGKFRQATPDKITGPGLWRVTADTWQVNLTATMIVQRERDTVTIKRIAWESGETEIRQAKVSGDVLLVVDNDVVELYTTSGDAVMTARYFD